MKLITLFNFLFFLSGLFLFWESRHFAEQAQLGNREIARLIASSSGADQGHVQNTTQAQATAPAVESPKEIEPEKMSCPLVVEAAKKEEIDLANFPMTDPTQVNGRALQAMLQLQQHAREQLQLVDNIEEILQQLQQGDGTVKDWSKVERVVKNILKNGGATDEASEELIFFARSKGLRVDSFESQFPESGLTEYYQAYEAWKVGDRGASMRYLEQCLRHRPGDVRYQMTLQQLQNSSGDTFDSSPFAMK